MSAPVRVVIIGGGITGLTAAYRLVRLADDAASSRDSARPVAVTLLEASDRLGGKIETGHVGGFVLDAGPDCFLSRKPRGVALAEELGIADRLVGRDPRYKRTYVKVDGALHRLPEGLSGMIPADLDALEASTLISPAGQARLAQELAQPAMEGDADESIAAFVRRRMGDEVYARLVEPLMSGIYAGDGEQLSILATFPQLRALEQRHGSLLRGLAGATPAPGDYPPFVSFPGGMETLVDALIGRLETTEIRLQSHVTTVTAQNDGGYTIGLATGETLRADAVLITTPAFVTAQLLAGLDPDLAEAHAAIPYASSATVNLGYAADAVPPTLDGYGYVIPRIEETDVLACTWSSNKWVGRAPAGKTLIRVYLGRFGRRDILQESDETLAQMAQQEVRATLGISATPDPIQVNRWPQGMPQYTLGHLDRLAVIEERLARHPGLYVAGAAYRGVGIPDCIREGEDAARSIVRGWEIMRLRDWEIG